MNNNLNNFDITSQKFFYHVSPVYLENGSVIKRGNWGRVLKQYMGGDCNGLNLFRERVLEEVRQKNFPAKPSRLNSTFLLLSIDEANIYRSLQNLRTSLIYKVSILDIAAAAHLGNYNKIQPTPPAFHFDNMDQVALEYWLASNTNDVFAVAHNPVNYSVDLIPNMPSKTPVNGLTHPVWAATNELVVESNVEIIKCED